MKPRIKFLMAGHLGWGTYRSRIEAAIQTCEEASIVVEHYQEPKWVRRIGRAPRYEEHLPRTLALLSEYEAYRLDGYLRRKDFSDCDAVVGVNSQVAATLYRSRKSLIPTLQVIDATLINMREDFGIAGISDRDIEVEKRCFHDHAHTIAMSRWVAKTLQERYGIAPEKITVVPPPSYSKATDFKPTRCRETRRPSLAFIGGDFIRKGGSDVLRWHKERWHTVANLEVVTRSVYSEENLPNTNWHLDVGPAYVEASVLRDVDLLVLPTHRDCSSFVTVEAASFGIPTVATNVGGISDLIEDGKTGILVDQKDREQIGDILTNLLNRPEVLKTMGEAAYNKYRNEFNLETVLKNIVNATKMAINNVKK